MENSSIFFFLQHPFIVSLFCTFQTESKFCLILEYVAGGDLMTYIKRNYSVPEEHARWLLLYFGEYNKVVIRWTFQSFESTNYYGDKIERPRLVEIPSRIVDYN